MAKEELPMSPVTAIGLMSGTSHDGIDLALINTDGEEIGQFGPTGYRPYADDDRVLLRRAMAVAANLSDRTARPAIVAEAEELVTRAHAEAVETFLAANGIGASDVGVIGFHGQTVLHRPERGVTVQLGDGPALAARLGIAVVHDFRAADVAAGGQGAPLTPVFHAALVRGLSGEGPIAVLNIGGVANLTFVDGDADPIACDIGPGNALIDDFMRVRTGAPQDGDGKAAAAGRVDEAAVTHLLAHEFFNRPPPKSLDRNEFRGWLARTGDLSDKSIEDGAATLTALTAAAIAGTVVHLPRRPAMWIVAGGGARNPTLMRMLTDRLAPAQIKAADAAGWSVDSLEAQAFAYLAVRSLRGLPITFPTTTGAPRPLTGGVVARP
jgi:anhydro-N-acetylmuramic acid kinase